MEIILHFFGDTIIRWSTEFATSTEDSPLEWLYQSSCLPEWSLNHINKNRCFRPQSRMGGCKSKQMQRNKTLTEIHFSSWLNCIYFSWIHCVIQYIRGKIVANCFVLIFVFQEKYIDLFRFIYIYKSVYVTAYLYIIHHTKDFCFFFHLFYFEFQLSFCKYLEVL